MFTGVATYYGARVAEEQLQQSREEAERSMRSQAAQVAYWVEETQGPTRIHFANQSPNPISEVLLEFYLAEIRTEAGKRPIYERVNFFVTLESVAPCAEVTFDARDMKRHPDSGMPVKLAHLDGSFTVRYAAFKDREGSYWVRDDTGLARAKSKSEAFLANLVRPTAPAGTVTREWSGSVKSRPTEKPARACEATTTPGL
ncbi:hypothetical protein [Streptomyces xantholiticus]|uniref:hypothetical protein n=1 Tax=Streptomyces xantholiticus TaxID=68285 RepID=UPI001671B3F4|nr:hypothetical protein [Streptomyces xantholiticus]GGW38248.1 hypothetical protein GCM10010381_23860 [Streptomyces xantholiticus]